MLKEKPESLRELLAPPLFMQEGVPMTQRLKGAVERTFNGGVEKPKLLL